MLMVPFERIGKIDMHLRDMSNNDSVVQDRGFEIAVRHGSFLVPPAKSLSTSVFKPSGNRGAAPSSAMLQIGQGTPAPPQSQPRGPSQGRRG
jgi:hypothetical protein